MKNKSQVIVSVSNGNFTSLPVEMVEHCLLFLSVRELNKISVLNKGFNNLSSKILDKHRKKIIEQLMNRPTPYNNKHLINLLRHDAPVDFNQYAEFKLNQQPAKLQLQAALYCIKNAKSKQEVQEVINSIRPFMQFAASENNLFPFVFQINYLGLVRLGRNDEANELLKRLVVLSQNGKALHHRFHKKDRAQCFVKKPMRCVAIRTMGKMTHLLSEEKARQEIVKKLLKLSGNRRKKIKIAAINALSQVPLHKFHIKIRTKIIQNHFALCKNRNRFVARAAHITLGRFLESNISNAIKHQIIQKLIETSMNVKAKENDAEKNHAILGLGYIPMGRLSLDEQLKIVKVLLHLCQEGNNTEGDMASSALINILRSPLGLQSLDPIVQTILNETGTNVRYLLEILGEIPVCHMSSKTSKLVVNTIMKYHKDENYTECVYEALRLEPFDLLKVAWQLKVVKYLQQQDKYLVEGIELLGRVKKYGLSEEHRKNVIEILEFYIDDESLGGLKCFPAIRAYVNFMQDTITNRDISKLLSKIYQKQLGFSIVQEYHKTVGLLLNKQCELSELELLKKETVSYHFDLRFSKKNLFTNTLTLSQNSLAKILNKYENTAKLVNRQNQIIEFPKFDRMDLKKDDTLGGSSHKRRQKS